MNFFKKLKTPKQPEIPKKLYKTRNAATLLVKIMLEQNNQNVKQPEIPEVLYKTKNAANFDTILEPLLEYYKDIENTELKENNKFYVLGDNIGFVKLNSVFNNETDICRRARTSHSNQDKVRTKEQDDKLLIRLLKDKHTSPFEFGKMDFTIKAPIFVARQWFRHRMANYSEQSGRYTEIKSEFYIPKQLNTQSKTNKQMSGEAIDNLQNIRLLSMMQQLSQDCYELYNELLKEGVSREQARMILPQNTYTTFCWQIDLNNLMKFLKLRTANDSQYEIRQYANKILEIMAEHYPTITKYFKENGLNGN